MRDRRAFAVRQAGELLRWVRDGQLVMASGKRVSLTPTGMELAPDLSFEECNQDSHPPCGNASFASSSNSPPRAPALRLCEPRL